MNLNHLIGFAFRHKTQMYGDNQWLRKIKSKKTSRFTGENKHCRACIPSQIEIKKEIKYLVRSGSLKRYSKHSPPSTLISPFVY